MSSAVAKRKEIFVSELIGPSGKCPDCGWPHDELGSIPEDCFCGAIIMPDSYQPDQTPRTTTPQRGHAILLNACPKCSIPTGVDQCDDCGVQTIKILGDN